MQSGCQSGSAFSRPYLEGLSRSGTLFLLLVALSLVGCSSFNRDWKRATLGPPPTDGLAGRWEGFWMSERNGHNGKLRCLITQSNSGPYQARFRAKYWKILAFGYTVPLTVERSNDTFRFEGEANLGRLGGGLYSYSGAVCGTNFHSTYRSKYDFGHFQMQRPD